MIFVAGWHIERRKGFREIGWGRTRNEKTKRSRRCAKGWWEQVRDKDSRMTLLGDCQRRGADWGFPYFKGRACIKCPEVFYCKSEWHDHFSFPHKIGGCWSDYQPSVVYSSSIAEESSRSREKELILDGRLNVHSEIDSAEQVPS